MAKPNYRDLTKEQLVALLEARDRKKFGLVWERDAIEHDRALNEDFVALVPVPDLHAGEGPFENLIIEGDNFDALRALRVAYSGQVKCIYIDPPYNTGNRDFVYNDRFVDKDHAWRHSMWLEFMYQRLTLAKDLLTSDGSIFVSINDVEVAPLRLLMDEIFGPSNFQATFIWRKVDSPNDNKVSITPDHESIYCFAADASKVRFKQLEAPHIVEAYGIVLEDGTRCRDRLVKKNGKNSLRKDRPTMWFPIEDPDGNDVYPIHDNGEEACWAMSAKKVAEHRENDTLIWKRRVKLGREVWEPYSREYAPTVPTKPFPTIWADLPTMRQAKAQLREIFNSADLFSTPKPVELIERILRMATDPGDTIVDFFAGSGTTAHTVLNLNATNGDEAPRRFILVSSTEATEEEPTKNVCRNVCRQRVASAISGFGDTPGTGGNFAYLRTKRIPMNRIVRRIDHTQVWLHLQLMHFESWADAAAVASGRLYFRTSGDSAVFYLTDLSPAVLKRVEKELAGLPDATLYTWQPEAVEAHFAAGHATVMPIPQTLIDRFGLRS